jgi:hypothetical protein
MKIYTLISVLFSTIVVGCTSKNFDTQLRDYISSHCDFSTTGTATIDLQNILSISYDTMYLFDGYSLPESVPVIAEGDTNITSKGGYLYGTEDDKVVFVKDKKIIENRRWRHKYVRINVSNKITKCGIFDGAIVDSLYEAQMYSSSIFKVARVPNYAEFTYVLEEVKQR